MQAWEEASQDALRTAGWAQTQKEVYKMCKQDQMTKEELSTTKSFRDKTRESTAQPQLQLALDV